MQEENVLCFVVCDGVQKFCVFVGIICVLVNNMVIGVFIGWECKFQLMGVGYCVQV